MMIHTEVRLERVESVLNESEIKRSRRHWASIQQGQPWLFDGPIVAAIATPSPDGVVVRWYPSTYSRYLARAVGGHDGGFDRALFASVVVRAREGHVLFGAMATRTSSPGRLQLPGGNVSLAPDGTLDEPWIRAEAARELREETSIIVKPEGLRLHCVSVGEAHGDVGFLYLHESELSADALLAAVEGEGEFDQFMFADPADTHVTASREWVDYAEGLLRSLRDGDQA